MFLFILGKTITRFNWICHAFVLMDNHYHLLIETIDANLGRGMQHLNSVFTQWHNAEHETVGHLFQGRYKAFIVEDGSYFREVARYIVLNPVRAKIVAAPGDYLWSSYRATAGFEAPRRWLTTKNILLMFSDYIDACEAYRKFVDDGGQQPSPFLQSTGMILGSEQYVTDLKVWLGGPIEGDFTSSERLEGRPALVDIFDGITDIAERDVAINLCVFGFGYSGAEVGRFLGLDRSMVSKILKKSNNSTFSA